MQAKAYTTRVGSGPYPTELFGDEGEDLRKAGFEWGTTTGRPRRCGWLDIVALNFACTINGFTAINLTKLDVLSGLAEVKLGVAYKTPAGDKLRSFPSDLAILEQVEVSVFSDALECFMGQGSCETFMSFLCIFPPRKCCQTLLCMFSNALFAFVCSLFS